MIWFVLESAEMALQDRPEKVGRLVLRDVSRTRCREEPGEGVFIVEPEKCGAE